MRALLYHYNSEDDTYTKLGESNVAIHSSAVMKFEDTMIRDTIVRHNGDGPDGILTKGYYYIDHNDRWLANADKSDVKKLKYITELRQLVRINRETFTNEETVYKLYRNTDDLDGCTHWHSSDLEAAITVIVRPRLVDLEVVEQYVIICKDEYI